MGEPERPGGVLPAAIRGVGSAAAQAARGRKQPPQARGGLLVHVPVALGLALGPGHNVEVALAMYQHFAVQQYVVAFTLSLSIPLGSSEADSHRMRSRV
jgi:hypothetical protein